MKKHIHGMNIKHRAVALLLALVLALGAVPAMQAPAEAASWSQPYLNKLVEWGVMRGDLYGNLHPDRNITRAEFVAMINRAFGYDQMGAIPFQDVRRSAWYYDDIAIAYHMGYYYGTSQTTARPLWSLTREEAVTLLGRNLLYRADPGETLGFTDSRTFSDWSRGMIAEGKEMGIIAGYSDGSFRPKGYITRGEMASVLVHAIGNLINKPGTQTLGTVSGNLTISTSGVTLRNTVVAGDLQLTGGLGLGDVLLENVTVLGKIVAAGAGESNKGDHSIILRNVTANEMVMDNLTNQFVSVRAEGDTEIARTSVRTQGYLEDATRTGEGLKYIELDAESGTRLYVAGNVREVVNITPGSTLVMAQGSAEKVTIDEKATNSTLTVESSAVIRELNLDVATKVTGTGGISQLNVSAAGCTVESLPDKITIRPGITASIAGEVMDSVAAAESSQEPRLQAGYPAARNVAPTGAEAAFSTNKRATVYWAITNLADGSVGAEDLIKPPTYTKILKSGSVRADKSSTEIASNIAGLTPDGSYYLSAVMVDSRGQQSPVKVAAFTTPDNTVPAFANGYPYMSKITNSSGQVAVMSTKTCMLYYALLPAGSAAPTVQSFRTGAISGNLGYGSVEMTKNVADVFNVNSRILQEQVSYDLYLCLIDTDSGQNSGVRRLSFKTVDGTPPVFLTEPTVNSINRTAVGHVAALNENGTIYWAVVKQGEEYPKPVAGQTVKPELTSDTAKMLVASGIGALKYGKVSATANRDVTINVTGLQPQTAYDLYYVAQDTAGNYSVAVKSITIHTLDDEPPTITQEFTKTADAAGKEPMPDTDIRVVFSEGIQDKGGSVFLELYNTARDQTKTNKERTTAADALIARLKDDVQLYDAGLVPAGPVSGSSATTGAWLDYGTASELATGGEPKFTVTMEEGKTILTLLNGKSIHLNSGGSYYFRISNIADTSPNKNMIRPNPQNLPQFTTVFARVTLRNSAPLVAPQQRNADGTPIKNSEVRIDMNFTMTPVSTQTVDTSVCYDVFLWSDSIIKYDVYARAVDTKTGAVVTDQDDLLSKVAGAGKTPDSNGWVYLGNDSLTPKPDSSGYVGQSVNRLARGKNITSPDFSQLRTLKDGWTYEYVVSLTQVGSLTEPNTWSQAVNLRVTVPAGSKGNVSNLSVSIDEKTWNDALSDGLSNGGIASVGEPNTLQLVKRFTDTQVPKFRGNYPIFNAGDAFVDMELMLDRAGTVYYVIAPLNDKEECLVPAEGITYVKDSVPPTSGEGWTDSMTKLTAPLSLDIYNPTYSNPDIKSGSKAMGTGGETVHVGGLKARTTYFAYFVLRGSSQALSDVYYFQFTTSDVLTPAIKLNESSPSVQATTDASAQLYWALFATNSTFPMLGHSFVNYVTDKDLNAAYTAGIGKIFSGVTDPKEPKVLDALMTTISETKDGVTRERSVFDVYASDSAKEEVLEWILGQRTSLQAQYADRGGPVSMGENNPQMISPNTNKMTTETRYYFLAAARNTQGSLYGFRAVGNVRKLDNTPPDYREPLLTALGTWDKDKYDKNPTQCPFSGTVTITFTKRPYLLSDLTKERVDLSAESGSKAILSHFGQSGVTITKARVNGNQITVTFENAKHGSAITLFTDGVLCNADSAARQDGKLLVLTFNALKTVSSDYVTTATPDPGWEALWK